MIENIKVDIIYFMTATDFEFEFNLGGCCHMRLLNDKVNDKKSFVNSLARAVSRSQIILAVGPLFGEDGLIATAAAAISHGLQQIDNKAYGIASDEKIEVIEGAVPLVTREGYFGGCIIESGNQSIIALTENRTIRKSIMKTLVHPYIEDMCIMQSAEKAGSAVIPEAAPQPAAPVQAEVPVEVELPAEEIPVPPAALAEAPAAEQEAAADEEKAEQEIAEEIEPEEAEPIMAESESEHNIEFEFSQPEDNKGEGNEISNEIEQDTEDMYFMPEPEEEKQASGKKGMGLSIAILVVCAALLVIVMALAYLLVFLPMVGGMSTSEYIAEIFSTTSSV